MVWKFAVCALIAGASLHSSAQPADALQPQLYDVITETALPNLEETLRYATTRERRCLEPDQLWSAFPILHHSALQGCRLEQEGRRPDYLSYVLACEGGHGTTGRATWQLGSSESVGTLDVKLGGKNMTFYQRITARPLGACR